MRLRICVVAGLGWALSGPLNAQTAVQLPAITVYSPRVANQDPVAGYVMPVSALRYEPRVDLQTRSLAEGQADVTIRGGIFENTGFRIGAVTVTDPQTGHYLAELPIAPPMLGAPEVLTGADLAAAVTNATVGAISYGWRRIRNGGYAQGGGGPHGLWQGELYQAASAPVPRLGATVGVDVDVAHSESNGPIALADHRFDRFNARLQVTRGNAQTDFFAGYQAKFFGWPNLYTPFNSAESDSLQTMLVAANHRVDLGDGNFVEAGVYERRNKDDYSFNRFAPLGPAHPYQHTTWQNGAAAALRQEVGLFTLTVRGEVLGDFLKSTSLTAGRYHSRTLTKLAVIPERDWTAPSGTRTILKLGATYDGSNRDGAAVSPVASLERQFSSALIRRIYASYAQTTQEPTYTALNSSATSGLFRGNPNLGRETSRNLEIGGEGALARWAVEGAAFVRRDDSLVDWTFQRGVIARTANAVDVDTAGVELVARRSWSAVDVTLGYTILAKHPDYRGARVDASFYALNYARQRLTAAATVRLGHGLELRIDNDARIQAPNLLRMSGGNRAWLTSVGLGFRPAAWPRVELTAQIDNLWNSPFEEIPAVPPAPREWSMGASYVW